MSPDRSGPPRPRHRLTALAVAPLLLAGATMAAAEGFEASTPDGRARVGVEGSHDGTSGSLRAHGNAGAYHFDNTVEGDQSGGRVTNPPMFGALGSGGPEREELYGPPVARAALGTGGLTAGISGTGTLTNLSWPSPGYWDHVNYLHRTRGYPNGGAAENAGAFAGLVLPGLGDDGGPLVTWLTPVEGWSTPSPAAQRYLHERSGQLVTELVNPDLPGVTVTIHDVVGRAADVTAGGEAGEVLARRFTVTGAPGGSRFLHYANLNPTTGRAPRVPSVTDALVDDASDFATAYDAGAGAMVHFRPYQVDPAATTVAVTGEIGSEPAAAALDRTFGPGVYVAVAGSVAPVDHQAGLDAVGLVRAEADGTALADPYYDARDGDLSGNPVAAGKTAGALAFPLDGSGSVTVGLAAADSAAAAVAQAAEVARSGYGTLAAAADADWAQWLADLRLPAGDDQTVAVSRRALMLIRTAQDRRTGAIVANTTTQTPYRQDWLRDGAFFNYALLLAGKADMVAAHNDFYRRSQSATGTWSPILCTDGAHCDAVFPFEIDAQAFGVWALWLHYELTGDTAELERSWEAIRKGAEVLWACQDPTNGLQCYASEDDHPNPTQGAQGASTVHLGLRVAADAADVVAGPGSEMAARWRQRAAEIKVASHRELCTDTGCDKGRGYPWWPARMYELGASPGVEASLDEMAATLAARATLQAPAPGGFFQYPMEPVFALTTYWAAIGDAAQQADRHAQLEHAISWLTHQVPEPGVLHYGERIFHLGGGRYLHSVGMPHIWSGTETYIAAAFVLGVTDCPPGATRIGEAACR